MISVKHVQDTREFVNVVVAVVVVDVGTARIEEEEQKKGDVFLLTWPDTIIQSAPCRSGHTQWLRYHFLLT